MVALLEECNEIWHAGDIGSSSVTDRLPQSGRLRAVYGNIDGAEIRTQFPPIARFTVEEVDVLMTHIGGYPGHYERNLLPVLKSEPPGLLVTGHSHILRVIYDQTMGFLFVNPGAAGQQGFHQVRTMVRFTVEGKQVRDLEVIELGKRGSLEYKPGSAPF
jgi:putative phosphoesterase